jgi:hypothetical protein
VGAVIALASPASAEPPEPPSSDGEEREHDHEDTWIDSGHSFLEEKLFLPVVGFDRFFSDETDLDPERARSFLQWRNDLRFEERRGMPLYTVGVRANLRMPGLNAWLKRIRLVIAGETRDAVSALFPDAGEDADALGDGNAEVRVGLWDGIVSHADVGAGLLFELPPGAFTRLRLRWAFPVRDLFLTRFATSGFWRTDTRLGTSADLHLERPLRQGAVARLSSQATLTQVSNGLEWVSEAAVIVGLGRRSAASVQAGLRGATGDVRDVERYRVSTRLRRAFLRRWLYFELEPEVYWPWTPERGRHATWAVTTRLEVQFHGPEPVKPAPEPPEPADPPGEPDPGAEATPGG